MTGIGISWHMDETGKAVANRTVRGGNIRLYDGERDYMDPTLDIYMGDSVRASIAAAAINGDWAEVRRLLPVTEDAA